VNGISLLGGLPLVIARSATSLNRVTYDNRGTLRSTVSIIDDSSLVEGLGLFMWTDTQLEPDDDETCFNTPNISITVGAVTTVTPAGQWLLQVPATDLLADWNAPQDDFMLNRLESISIALFGSVESPPTYFI
jgi:hypothetical protein